MSITDSDDALVLTEFKNAMKTDGWTPLDEVPPGIIKGWKPDAVFQTESGRVILLELEQVVNIPHFIVRIRNDKRNCFDKASIIVLSKRNTPLDIQTARIGLQNGISVYAGGARKKSALDSEISGEFVSLEPERLTGIRTRFECCKRIPSVITKELQDLRNLEYANDLHQFAHDYEAVEFDSLDKEHQFVHEFITKRLSNRYAGASFLSGLNVMSLLENLSQVVHAKREHFLHSFQVFLLGSIVIDKWYSEFNTWYGDCFDPRGTAAIDVPWLFASLFHDIGNIIVSVSGIPIVRKGVTFAAKGMSSIFGPRLLGCLFEALRNGPMRSDWIPSASPSGVSDTLERLLSGRRTRDHGVMGAIDLLSCAAEVEGDTLTSVIWPASLAIAIHSTEMWPLLVQSGLFPVKAKAFPLTFLLFLCDNLEEWGREPYATGRNQPDSSLLEMDFHNQHLAFAIWVCEKAIAPVIRNRYQWIMKELFDPGDITLECDFFCDEI
jgi:hypothetical protein